MDKTDTNSIAATSAYFLFATFHIYEIPIECQSTYLLWLPLFTVIKKIKIWIKAECFHGRVIPKIHLKEKSFYSFPRVEEQP